ncbi:hypothetical protein BC940DRAFT_307540 [Gongronella butleri]|nr:hypothetical protein BC940DRAFT_307540 [Gongronella butleri]
MSHHLMYTDGASKTHLLLQLAPVPLALWIFASIHSVLSPFNKDAKSMCQRVNEIHDSVDIWDVHPSVDRITCVLVRFCTVVVNHASSAMITHILLGQAAVMYAVMVVEGQRQAQLVPYPWVASLTSLLPIILIYAGNIVGAGPITMLFWLPITGLLHFICLPKGDPSDKGSSSSSSNGKNDAMLAKNKGNMLFRPHQHDHHHRHHGAATASMTRLPAARLLSTFFISMMGQYPLFLLAVYMSPSRMQQNVLAVFQHTPLFFPWVHHLAERLAPSSRTRSWHVGDLYLGLAAVNALLYWMAVLYNLFRGNEDTSLRYYVVLLLAPPKDLLDTAQLLAPTRVTIMLVLDLLAMVLTFAYWVWLRQGRTGLKRLCAYSLVGGPGAGLALTMCQWEFSGE